MFSVAVATYLSLYPSMLIIPVILMLTRKINDNDLTKVGTFGYLMYGRTYCT